LLFLFFFFLYTFFYSMMGCDCLGSLGITWAVIAWAGIAWAGIAWAGIAWAGIAWAGIPLRNPILWDFGLGKNAILNKRYEELYTLW
jgi:hypothetical protein